MRQKLSEEYGRVAAAVPQECLRYARRQAVLERNPWGQGRDAAMRMVTRALAEGDDFFRTPIVSPETGYIFAAFTDDAVRLVANGALALETDEYYKSVESLGLARDDDFVVLTITTTVRNHGVTVERFLIQRATREVACVRYKMFFRRVLGLNPTWARIDMLIAIGKNNGDLAIRFGDAIDVLRLHGICHPALVAGVNKMRVFRKREL